MIGGIDGRGLSIPRGGPIPPRGERYPGIHAIEVYVPRHCVQADALEMEHDCKGKYTDGLQMQQWGACDEDEDVVSMARTAVRRLVEKQGLAWEDIGMLNVGTESLLDRSKSIKSHLMDLFPPDVVGVEPRDPSPSRILGPVANPNPGSLAPNPAQPEAREPNPHPDPEQFDVEGVFWQWTLRLRERHDAVAAITIQIVNTTMRTDDREPFAGWPPPRG